MPSLLFTDKILHQMSPYYSSGSIEIDAIDVSNLRRFSSRRNRIGSNRTKVTKLSMRPGFEYTFFALTLNPMGKTRCLEIEEYAGDTPAGVCGQSEMSIEQVDLSLSKPSLGIGSHSLRAYCRLPCKINVKDSDRSMEFISFYIFKCHHGDEMRLKQYAGILLIECWADLIYNMDTGKAAVCEPAEAKMARPAGGPFGISRFI